MSEKSKKIDKQSCTVIALLILFLILIQNGFTFNASGVIFLIVLGLGLTILLGKKFRDSFYAKLGNFLKWLKGFFDSGKGFKYRTSYSIFVTEVLLNKFTILAMVLCIFLSIYTELATNEIVSYFLVYLLFSSLSTFIVAKSKSTSDDHLFEYENIFIKAWFLFVSCCFVYISNIKVIDFFKNFKLDAGEASESIMAIAIVIGLIAFIASLIKIKILYNIKDESDSKEDESDSKETYKLPASSIKRAISFVKKIRCEYENDCHRGSVKEDASQDTGELLSLNYSATSLRHIIDALTTAISAYALLVIITHDFYVIETATLATLGGFFAFINKDWISNVITGYVIYRDKLISLGERIRIPEYDINGYIKSINKSNFVVVNYSGSEVSLPLKEVLNTPFHSLKRNKKNGQRIKFKLYINPDSIKKLATFKELKKLKPTSKELKKLKPTSKELKKLKPTSKEEKEQLIIEKIQKRMYGDGDGDENPKFEAVYDYLDFIKDYICNKYKINLNADDKSTELLRSFSNLGLLRVYLAEYLNQVNFINEEQISSVKILNSDEFGIPIEVSAFVNPNIKIKALDPSVKIDDVEILKHYDRFVFEFIQSDLAEHVITAAQAFDLTIASNSE
jgi:hypothetical protein